MQLQVRCICNPSLVVGAAKKPFGERVAAVGDMAVSRQYKDGILAAHNMAASVSEVIMNSGVDYMFRTTVVPGLVDVEDIVKMGKILKGTKVFQIQQFVPVNTVDPRFEQKKPFSKQDIMAMAEKAWEFSSEVRFEGS